MNNPNQTTNHTHREPEQPLGVLACITAGFEITARRPWLLLLPVLLDLFLWLGPRLSVAPLLAEVKATIPPEAVGNSTNYQILQETLDQLSGQFNLFGTLSPGPLVGLPTLMRTRMMRTDAPAANPWGLRPTWTVASLAGLWGYAFLFGMIGLALNVLYLRQVGQSVIQETESALPGPGSPIALWIQLCVSVLVALPMALLITMPMALAVSGLLTPGLGSILSLVLLSFIFYVVFHLVFVVPGLVQLRKPLLRAVWESALLVQVDFMRVLALVLIILGVTAGLNFVWSLPEPTSWATLVGIGGHAFVATALTVALFVFYQERLGYLQALQQARATRPAHSHVGD